MGMSPRGILFGVELPLAVPIIAAGARTSLVLAVAVVPLGTDLNAGGLGRIVFPAIKLDRISSLVAGALMIAVLALMIDWLGGLAQRLLTPEGIR
jgi:osmoprotectant transport system permease protein